MNIKEIKENGSLMTQDDIAANKRAEKRWELIQNHEEEIKEEDQVKQIKKALGLSL